LLNDPGLVLRLREGGLATSRDLSLKRQARATLAVLAALNASAGTT
jgi:hypothetical protein